MLNSELVLGINPLPLRGVSLLDAIPGKYLDEP